MQDASTTQENIYGEQGKDKTMNSKNKTTGVRGSKNPGIFTSKQQGLQMNEKTKITLTPEQETLLITLYTKAQPGNPLFFDPKAQDILGQVDYNFTRLRVPYKTVILICQRAKKLDAVTRDFLVEYPNGVVLHLGCGLDNRF